MTHILWCGGSHLAFAKESILNYFNQGQNSFLITAGPVLARWAMKGGRYEIKSTKSSETLFRQSINNAYPEESIDVSNYSTIIFVGQWLVPRQLFRPKTLLSPGTIDAICTEDNILNPSTGPLNEPLIIFPKLAENRSKIILLPDPFPVKNYKTSNGFFWQIH